MTEKLFSRRLWLGCSLIVPVMLAGCGDKSTGPGENRDSDIAPQSVTWVHFGGGQAGQVGEPLARPIGVGLVDETGAPAAGVTVEFTVIQGNGTVVPTVTTTNFNGTARTVWILGTVSGSVHSVSANIRGFDFAPVVFTATGLPGAGRLLTLLAGDGQIGHVGSVLPCQIVVQATDEFGNGVPGQLVKFGPNTGNGEMNPRDVSADGDGKALARWTLGVQVGVQEASIWSPGLTGSPVWIQATAQSEGAVQACRVANPTTRPL